MNFICYFLLFFLISCDNQVEVSTEEVNDKVSKLIIFNKTNNKYIADTTIIEDVKIIDEFNLILSKRTKGDGYNVKNNFGYYEIKICTTNSYCINLDIIYTVYDGVVLRYNRAYYKQDDLERFVIKFTKKVTPQ